MASSDMAAVCAHCVDLILISSKVYLFANELIDWLID